MDQHQPPNKNSSSTYGEGIWAMGNPAAPYAYPNPTPNPAYPNANYMCYSAYPPPPPSAYQYPYAPPPPPPPPHPPQPINPYVHASPVPGKRPVEALLDVVGRWGKKVEKGTKKAEGIAGNVWHHLKTSPSVSDAAMARLAQGTKVLTEGGHDKVFQQTFDILPGEKLQKAYACHLSTSSGPVIGTLYLSTRKIAFCSDSPLCHTPSTGQQAWIYYKVVIKLEQLNAVNPSTSRAKPTEKYIQIVTVDGHEFWFMGFVSYDKALKNLMEALQHNVADPSAVAIQRSS